jgi:hypothetical protein
MSALEKISSADAQVSADATCELIAWGAALDLTQRTQGIKRSATRRRSTAAVNRIAET